MASEPLTDAELERWLAGNREHRRPAASMFTDDDLHELGLDEEQPDAQRVPFEEHRKYMDRTWKRGQHLSVLGQTGSGKTHLIRHLLELWRDAEVLVIDTKGDDDAWEDGFTRVKEAPSWWDRFNARLAGAPSRKWWRLVPPDSRPKRRDVVRHAMDSAFKRGNLVVVLDEVRSIAGKHPNLALDEPAHRLWQQGRSKGITVVGGAQSPVFLPSAFYDESKYLYVGYVADARRLKRVGEIAADVDEMLEVAASTREHEFVFAERKRDAKPVIVKAPKHLPRVRQPSDPYQLV